MKSEISAKSYPTKEEILANLYKPSKEEKAEIQRWKDTWYIRHPKVDPYDEYGDEDFARDTELLTKPGWRNQSTWKKWQALKDLIIIICEIHEVPAPQFYNDDHEIGWRYLVKEKTIVGQRNNPSIISTLHELGHHLYGAEEITACQFSIGIFNACFPQSYSRLKWDGHALRK